MPVYFIRDESNRVKIGHCVGLEKRLSLLQTGSAENLTFLRVIEGGQKTEAWLHKHFADRHIRGEWFKFHDDMLTALPPYEVTRKSSGPLITHADIMALWPRISHLAADLKVPYGRAHKWTKRQYIDPVYWNDLILVAAQRFNIVISHQQLTHGANLVRMRFARAA